MATKKQSTAKDIAADSKNSTKEAEVTQKTQAAAKEDVQAGEQAHFATDPIKSDTNSTTDAQDNAKGKIEDDAQTIAKDTSGDTAEDLPEDLTGDTAEDLAGDTPEDLTEDTPEDLAEESDDSLTFSNGVIEKIVAIAMREVDGVIGMKGGWINRVQDAFGASDPRKGVTVEVTPDARVKVYISVLIEYGAYAPAVFEEVKKVVEREVTGMTGLGIAGVNLRIEDVLTREEAAARRKAQRASAQQDEEAQTAPAFNAADTTLSPTDEVVFDDMADVAKKEAATSKAAAAQTE